MKKLLGILLMSLVILLACGEEVEKNDTFTIGLLVTLTGPAAIHGTHVAMGAEKAVAEINSEGGNLRLVIEDNMNQPKEGINAYRKVALQRPDLIFTTMSGASATAIPLAVEEDIPVVTSLTYADFREYDNVYQYFQTTEDLTSIASDFFKDQGITEIGLLSSNIEAGHALMNIAREKFEGDGLEIVGEEFYTPDDPDQKTQIFKLADKEPQAIYVFDLRPDRVVKQIKDQYDGLIVFSDTPVSTNLFKTIEDLDGVYAAAHEFMIKGTEENSRFEELFEGKDANPEAGMGYDVVHLVWNAVKDGGEIPGAITELGEFKGLSGIVDLDSSRKPSIPIKMVLIKDKELVLV
ncbi:MAG: ABC transporter substrate-binding protein [Candidatus Woesearchaeota archaeon]|nr:ABC transporter substrate-binding protein [Candidatus Woesearchaeota archaeon]